MPRFEKGVKLPKAPCPICGEEKAEKFMHRHIEMKHGPGAVSEMEGREPVIDADPEDGAYSESSYVSDSAEPARKTWRDRLRGNKGTGSPDPAPTKEKRPKRTPMFTGKRQSGASAISNVLGLMGGFAMNTPYKCTARMLQVQAPYSGHVLDQAVAGTLVDRMAIQPMVRLEEKGTAVAAVVGPTMWVFSIEKAAQAGNWDRVNQLVPFLKETLRVGAPHIARGLKEQKKREAEIQEAMTELFEDQEIPPGVTPLDMMIGEILAPVMGAYAEAEMRARTEQAMADAAAEGNM